MKERINSWIAFAKKNERHISVAALLFGFVFDTLTLGRPDQLYGNIVLLTHLVISAAAIYLLARYEEKKRPVPPLLIPVMQFSFGNLASGLLVVYGQSGSFEGSALFFLVMIAFLLGNEFLRTYYARLSFHLAAWYFLLFGYLAIAVPIVFGRFGDLMFVISGLISLLFVAGFLFLMKRVSRQRVVMSRKTNIALIAGIFFLYIGFYFGNIIPPVPLALTEIGVYHSIERTGTGDYQAAYERGPWYEFYRDTSSTFTKSPGETAYCFSSVFAPVRISTEIYHRWEKENDATGEWVTQSRIPYNINGGRAEGYRGYSELPNIAAGDWRCSVEAATGGIIGRTTFTVAEGTPSLSTREL